MASVLLVLERGNLLNLGFLELVFQLLERGRGGGGLGEGPPGSAGAESPDQARENVAGTAFQQGRRQGSPPPSPQAGKRGVQRQGFLI